MKKINMLIALFAVMTTVSVAGAEDIKVDFDGKGGGAFIGDIKAAGEKGGISQFVADPIPTVNCGGIDYPVAAMPMACGGWALPPEFVAALGRRSGRFAKGTEEETLARTYLAQTRIKEIVAEYYTANNNEAAAAALASKDVRIAATGGVVYVVDSGKVAKIEDSALAGTITEIIQPRGQQKSAASVIAAAAADSAVTGNVIAGGALLIGCMVSDPCWNAVGDGVSDASEWAHNGTHWWN